MDPTKAERRAALLIELREMRLEAIRVAKKLARREETRDLAHGLVTRSRAVQRLLERDARLAVDEVRTAAELDALVEAIAELSERTDVAEGDRIKLEVLGRKMEQCSRKDGELAVERARLNGHLLAEHSALRVAKKLLVIRLAARTQAQQTTRRGLGAPARGSPARQRRARSQTSARVRA